MIAVLKHELSGYFHSLTAYIFSAFLLAFVGIGALIYNIQSAVANFEYVLGYVCLGLVVIIPILTMRIIAEERKQKTDQLLYSLPIRTFQIVMGKYIALLAVFFGSFMHCRALSAHLCAVWRGLSTHFLWLSFCVFYDGSRNDRSGDVYFFADGESGVCSRNRHPGYFA